MTRKLLPFLAVLAVFAGLFAVAATPGKADNPKTVHMGSFSKAVDYAPYLIARNKGWLDEAAKKYGATMDYTEFQSLPPINEALATDRLDVVFEAEAPAIVGRAAGIDVRIVGAGAFVTLDIIVPSDSPITNAAELKGKKVAVLAGTSAHQGLMTVLARNGLKASDIEVLDMMPPDAKAAFESGQVDAWAVWPPFQQQEEVAGKGRAVPGTEIFIQSIMAARGGFADSHPDILADLKAVIEKAQDWMTDNEAEAQQIVAAELGLTEDVVKAAWPKHDFHPSIGEKEIADIKAKADFLQGMGLIRESVDPAAFVTAD